MSDLPLSMLASLGVLALSVAAFHLPMLVGEVIRLYDMTQEPERYVL